MTIVRLFALALALLFATGAVRPGAASAPLYDHTGSAVSLAQLTAGKTAVYAFVFTGCSSSCPLIGQRVAQVQRKLGTRSGKDVVFIGVSVDPIGDRPAAMRKFSADMGLGAGWHFISGRPDLLQKLRDELGGGAGGAGHGNYLVIRNTLTGATSRIDALTNSAQAIADRVKSVADGRTRRSAATAHYLEAGKLTDAQGRQVDFYRDVVAGRVVLINTIFTRCVDACPLITEKLARARKMMGKEGAVIRFVSISNDPAYDNPARLREFARQHRISGDWVLLAGAEPDVRKILGKLNLGGSGGTDHSTALVVTNDRTGSWQRVSPAIEPAELAMLLRRALAETTA